MPSIELKLKRLSKLVGKELTLDQLEYDLQWIGLDVDEVLKEENAIKVEYSPNRPDFASPEGIARALKGYYGIETGLAKFNFTKGTEVMKVDAKVRKVRPYVVCGIVRNIKLDDDEVRTMMNIQEDLHWSVGRDRKKVAIGIHDYDKVRGPYKYTTVKPNGVKFRPLHMENLELTPQEILEEHDMGKEYAHLLVGFDEYPIIYDAEGKVVSFPPIINGVYTTVTENTRNLLLDLTGTSFEAVNLAINIIAATFADMGAQVEMATVIYEDEPEKAIMTPNMTPKTWNVHVDYINSYLGLSLKPKEMIDCLKKCRLDARTTKDKNILEVDVPAYRNDVMHEVDFTEEVAIGYGYQNLPITIREGGFGQYHPSEELANLSRMIMIGAGSLEMVNSILCSQKDYERLKISFSEKDNIIIENPVSDEFNAVRSTLMIGLMKSLNFNIPVEKPFNIFEVGDVILLDPTQDTGARRELHLAAAVHSEATDYTEIKALFDHYIRTLGVIDKIKVKPASIHGFIEGRTAEIYFENQKIGVIGEIHPEILENYKLDLPTALFELNITPFFKEKIR